MKLYPFIEAEKVGQRNVGRACQLLKVSPFRLLRRPQQRTRYSSAGGRRADRPDQGLELPQSVLARLVGRRTGLMSTRFNTRSDRRALMPMIEHRWLPRGSPKPAVHEHRHSQARLLPHCAQGASATLPILTRVRMRRPLS